MARQMVEALEVRETLIPPPLLAVPPSKAWAFLVQDEHWEPCGFAGFHNVNQNTQVHEHVSPPRCCAARRCAVLCCNVLCCHVLCCHVPHLCWTLGPLSVECEAE